MSAGAVMIRFLMMAMPSLAQVSGTSTLVERPQRVVLVSIPDRKLAVLENGKVLAYFPVAVGAAISPSPTGEFEIVSRVANPTYYHPGVVMAPATITPWERAGWG